MVLIIIGLWVRASLEETPVFEAALQSAAAHDAPVLEALKRRPRQVAIGGGLKFGENISFYLMTAFGITYITEMLHLPRSVALNGVLVGAALGALTMPLWGWLSDRIGRRPVYGFGAAALIAWAFAFYPLLETKSPALIVLAMAVGVGCAPAMNGPVGAPSRSCSRPGPLPGYYLSIEDVDRRRVLGTADLAGAYKHYHSSSPGLIYLAGSCGSV